MVLLEIQEDQVFVSWLNPFFQHLVIELIKAEFAIPAVVRRWIKLGLINYDHSKLGSGFIEEKISQLSVRGQTAIRGFAPFHFATNSRPAANFLDFGRDAMFFIAGEPDSPDRHILIRRSCGMSAFVAIDDVFHGFI